MAAQFEAHSDEQLAAESQTGSLVAFEELVYRYERRIYGFVARFCRNPSDACEVTQETFVKAFQAIGQFDKQHDFAAWLFTIARRKCIDHHRVRPKPTVNEEDPPDLADSLDPSEALAGREDRQGLWQLARKVLSETQYQALWLRYVEDLTVAEIAQVLRKTRTHVKVLLFRARNVLGRELAPGSEVRSQRPEARGQKSEVRDRLSEDPPSGLMHHASRVTL